MQQDRHSPDEFTETLTQCGMPPKQAEVYAHRNAFNKTNSETATELNKTDSTISNQYNNALTYTQNARKLTHYTHSPEYLTTLSQPVGETLYEQVDFPIHIRLHRPQTTTNTDYEYTLTDSETIETYAITTDSDTPTEYLLVYNYPQRNNNGTERKYFTINAKFVSQFIADWLLPNRHSEFRHGNNSYADQWFLTELFDVNAIESDLKTAGITPTEVLTDTRFEPPTPDTIQLTNGAKTGTAVIKYKPAYVPTEDEIDTAIKQGRIEKHVASEIKFNNQI